MTAAASERTWAADLADRFNTRERGRWRYTLPKVRKDGAKQRALTKRQLRARYAAGGSG